MSTLKILRLDTNEVPHTQAAIVDSGFKTIYLDGSTLVVPSLGLVRDTVLWFLEEGPRATIGSFRTGSRIRNALGMSPR